MNRQKRFDKGKCRDCTRDRLPDNTYCQNCIDKKADYTKRRDEQRKGKGLCRYCDSARDGESNFCRPCLNYQRFRQRTFKIKSNPAGITRQEFFKRIALPCTYCQRKSVILRVEGMPVCDLCDRLSEIITLEQLAYLAPHIRLLP